MPMHRSRALIILTLCLALSGCSPAVPTPLTEAQMQTRVAEGVAKGQPSNVLPPTWTPTPTVLYTETPTPAPRPTQAPPTPVVSITPAPPASPTPAGTFTLSGSGHFVSEVFALPAGKISVAWKYEGYNYEVERVTNLQEQLEQKLADMLEWRNSTKSYYEEVKNAAKRRHDQKTALEAEAAIKDIENDYRLMVKAAEKGFQINSGHSVTNFILTINRQSVDLPRVLGSGAGGSSGTAEYEAKDAADYYFTIRAPGDWTIEVTSTGLE